MSLAKFRQHYPQGSLVSKLIEIDRGIYIVQASIQIDGVVLATALGGASQVETAEDIAQQRAIALLCLDSSSSTNSKTNSKQIENSVIALETSKKTTIKPTVSSPPVPFSTPQSPSALTEIKPKSSPIVNFSEAQGNQNNLQSSASEKLPAEDAPNSAAVLPTKAHLTQGEEVAHEVNANPVVSSQGTVHPSSSKESNNNLFGDTFEAAIPEEVTLAAPNPLKADSQAVADVTTSEIEVINFNEIKQRTDIEIKRLGWTKEQGKEFLMSHYGKRSRLHLTDEQLLEFLRYLEKLPNPLK